MFVTREYTFSRSSTFFEQLISNSYMTGGTWSIEAPAISYALTKTDRSIPSAVSYTLNKICESIVRWIRSRKFDTDWNQSLKRNNCVRYSWDSFRRWSVPVSFVFRWLPHYHRWRDEECCLQLRVNAIVPNCLRTHRVKTARKVRLMFQNPIGVWNLMIKPLSTYTTLSSLETRPKSCWVFLRSKKLNVNPPLIIKATRKQTWTYRQDHIL